MGQGPASTLLRALQSTTIPSEGTGKLLAIEERDGRSFAKVQINAKIAGKGDPQKLGLGAAFGGRGPGRGGPGGGQGGGQGGGAASSEVDLTITFDGIAWVDLTEKQISSLDLNGKLGSKLQTRRTMDFGGEEREMDMTTNSDGTFSLKVTTAPAQSK
jgi:hypothetical protein